MESGNARKLAGKLKRVATLSLFMMLATTAGMASLSVVVAAPAMAYYDQGDSDRHGWGGHHRPYHTDHAGDHEYDNYGRYCHHGDNEPGCENHDHRDQPGR